MIRIGAVVGLIVSLGVPASAEVRFGNNVRIGGHDVSNQTFTKKKRGKFVIHEKEPKNAGCVWQQNADGSKTQVCNFKRKKNNESR